MIKSFLKRRGQDGQEVAAARGDDSQFEIISARLPGRSVITFQKRGGQATALEVTDQGAEILKGLAAGAVVSELEDARTEDGDGEVMPLTGGSVATRAEAEAFIQSLDLLDMADKRRLLGALPR